MIALNEKSVTLHKSELNQDAIVLADSFELTDLVELGDQAIVLPITSSAKEVKAPMVARNSVAIGALCAYFGLDFDIMQRILQNVFKDKKPEINIKLANIGFEFFKKLGRTHPKKLGPDQSEKELKELIDGNTAFARGLLAAGLNFYVAYPMTPSSSILHYLAGQQKNYPELKVIQPENELAAINMALGMSYAGKRVAIGSATGGFTLMLEAFSFAGGAELPLVVAVSQRQAPATGAPTFSSQTDLQMVIHAGHGEFPRVIIAPGDATEAYLAGANALNLAWKYQLPAVVLMDKIVSEHPATNLIPTDKIEIETGKLATETGESYGRYEITADGISPLAFPGTPKTVVKVTSYEHDEAGITTEEPTEIKAMIEKRFTKAETLAGELEHQETIKIYGDKQADAVIVFWGSTKGPVLEAVKYLKRPAKLVQIVWVEPFDVKRVFAALTSAKKIINVECNHNAQMAALIREKTGLEVSANILKYDSRPFDPLELADKINELNHG